MNSSRPILQAAIADGPNVVASSHQPKRMLAMCVVGCALLVSACKSSSPTEDATGEQAQQLTPHSDALPKLELRDDTADLLLTWIDENGDFKVVQSTQEVPEGAREKVRVVVTTQEAGTGQRVYVADLRQKQSDGSYAVASLARSEWNQLGAERRKVRMEAFAPAEPAASAAAATTSADGKEVKGRKVRAVIYGADWCKPCHDAEKLLKKLGADVTKKDIEKSRAAQAEMQLKLRKAGRTGASIPVIDVQGKLFVGYSAHALKRAVAAAQAPETL